MHAITYRTARTRFSEIMDRVCAKHEPITIVARDRERAVVLMSLDNYKALKDACCLPEDDR